MVFLVGGPLKICESLLKSVVVTDNIIQDTKKSYCGKAFSGEKETGTNAFSPSNDFCEATDHCFTDNTDDDNNNFIC